MSYDVGYDIYQYITAVITKEVYFYRKWKGDKGSVYSISLCHSKKHLLSAGRKIKLWDLDTKQVLKVSVASS